MGAAVTVLPPELLSAVGSAAGVSVDDDGSTVNAMGANDAPGSCIPMARTCPLVDVAYIFDGGIATVTEPDGGWAAADGTIGVPSAFDAFTSGGNSINELILCDIIGVVCTILDAGLPHM